MVDALITHFQAERSEEFLRGITNIGPTELDRQMIETCQFDIPAEDHETSQDDDEGRHDGPMNMDGNEVTNIILKVLMLYYILKHNVFSSYFLCLPQLQE